jgi:Ca-activated chloride channel family protein
MSNPTQGFLLPLLLWLFVALLGFLLIVLRGMRHREAAHRRLTGAAPKPQSLLLLGTIPALLIVALSRPYWGFDLAQVAETHDELMFVVDVSRSMLAKDIPPSRIALAKRKMRDVIDLAVARGIPLRYGITIFAGGSYVLCPTTSDTAVVKQFIDEISPEMVSSLGSHLALGLKTALARHTQNQKQLAHSLSHIRLLLISDGEEEAGQTNNEAVELARGNGIRIDVLGVGTVEGAQLTLEDGKFVYNSLGAVVHSSLNENVLREIAHASGGSYRRAGVNDSDIEALLPRTETGLASTFAAKRTIVTYRELGPLLTLLALATLMLLLVTQRNLMFSILVAAPALAAPTADLAAQTPQPAPAQISSPLSSAEAARRGYEAYQRGDFAEAELAFREALQSDPANRRLQQSHASALFRNGKSEEAAKTFHDVAAKTAEGKEYFENTYNEGNALLQLGRYQDAIDAYGKALDVKPDDERALHNLRVARARLRELQSRPTPTPQSEQKGSPQPHAKPEPTHADSEQSETAQEQSQQDQPQLPETESHTPTPAAEALGTPLATPSAAPLARPATEPDSSKPSGHPTPLKEALPPRAETPDLSPTSTTPGPTASPADTLPPSSQEADAWLESLPESPLIITRDRPTRPSTGQTW